ncbi:phage antirepressor KilAC domain-containing protein [Butyricimonas sp.]|jgi:anti-repressor protein|uniref:phage antirepressor KilAC domain-containing protein n=1 Tax=Butyricimonas sp. TaxID=1969738 RepID=UPI001B2ADAD1|nr:phage antirepressor KilAC domain-containing protein [Butyricimonas sp.]MBO4957514.1 phage antirepressor KilAC domain-containing protein [Butyricimonas sp.]
MNELIKITERDGKQAVSARELYAFLEIQTPFTMWAERMFEYGFTENVDYVSLSQKSEKPQGGRPQIDYALSISCAKEISMLQRNDKGKQARQYFIEAENKYRELQKSGGFQVPTSFREALLLAAQQQEKIEEQQKQLAEQAPKVLFANAVEASQKSCLIGELAKILRQNGVNIGEKRLFSWMREKGYLCSYGERYNQPTQKSMDLELFEMKKTTITKPSGEILVSVTSKVSGKGQVYFVNKFLKQKELV